MSRPAKNTRLLLQPTPNKNNAPVGHPRRLTSGLDTFIGHKSQSADVIDGSAVILGINVYPVVYV